MKTEMYRFETRNFIIRATIEDDNDLDLSWDDDGETRAKLASGEYQAFGTMVTVSTRNGIELAEDSLWGNVYADPREFFCGHRNADPMQRNCSIMRAANGQNVCIGYYFPGMIRAAIEMARDALHSMPKLKD